VYDNAAANLTSAVKELKDKVELTSTTGYVDGEKATDSEQVKNALKEANAYLDVTVTCNFTPATGEAATEAVGKDQIAQWLIVGNDGMSVSLDGENMATYCTELAKKHDVSKKKTGQFKTTGGSIINVPVVSSQCVTGCISKGHGTPTGVYSIFSRDKDRYLRGDGYKSWVNFFIPFNGGIGFHDASWRSTFGGNIYLYSGSHGCINMPYSAAKKLYENVTLDEKVIVYGGVDKVAGKAQSLGGADSYNVTEGDGAFNLGVTAEDNAKLTYSSDNNGVVRVDENGNVTIAGVGTATITVKSEATTSYKAGSKTITITVNAKPQPNQTPSVTIGCGNKTVTEGDAPFSLGASASNGAALSYQSSDPSIASVDGAGNVTIYRAGSVQITAIAGEMAGWNSASSSITVTVNSKPQPQPVAPTEPSEQPQQN
jgi:hypothetical protein